MYHEARSSEYQNYYCDFLLVTDNLKILSSDESQQDAAEVYKTHTYWVQNLSFENYVYHY